MADAREALLHRLSNYAKYEGMEVIVVFDAQLVPGIQQNYKKYQLDVVFTKEDETADSYIERIAGQLNTSDSGDKRFSRTVDDLFPRSITNFCL